MQTADPLLRTKPIAEALGVSVSTIKRWVDSGSLPGVRTVGRHRLVPYSEVVKFAGRQGLSVRRLESLVEVSEGVVRAATDGDACHSLLSALVAGDRKRARAILFAFHASGGGRRPSPTG